MGKIDCNRYSTSIFFIFLSSKIPKTTFLGGNQICLFLYFFPPKSIFFTFYFTIYANLWFW